MMGPLSGPTMAAACLVQFRRHRRPARSGGRIRRLGVRLTKGLPEKQSMKPPRLTRRVLDGNVGEAQQQRQLGRPTVQAARQESQTLALQALGHNVVVPTSRQSPDHMHSTGRYVEDKLVIEDGAKRRNKGITSRRVQSSHPFEVSR